MLSVFQQGIERRRPESECSSNLQERDFPFRDPLVNGDGFNAQDLGSSLGIEQFFHFPPPKNKKAENSQTIFSAFVTMR